MRFVLRRNTHVDCYNRPHHTWYALDEDNIAYYLIKRNFTPHGWKGRRSGTTLGQHYRVYHECSEIARFRLLRDAKAMIEQQTPPSPAPQPNAHSPPNKPGIGRPPIALLSQSPLGDHQP